MLDATAAPDLIFRQVRLIDGTGAPERLADVALRGERIVALAERLALSAPLEIQGRGQVLAPGFIDVHTHDDRVVIDDPIHLCKISQGVTTVVTGNCGVSLAPLSLSDRPPPPLDLLSGDPRAFFADFKSYLARLDAEPASVNVAAQVGHSTLRVATMSDLRRPASADEIVRMRRLLEASLDAGAIGLSTGLFYRTADASSTEEVIAVTETLRGRRGALYTTHMRDEADRVDEALRESFRIGRESGVPVVISHHKCCGTRNFGRARDTLALIDAANAEHPTGLDVYPYDAASSVLDVEKFSDASRIRISWSKAEPAAAGRDLAELAAERGLGLKEMADRLQPAGGIYFMMDEADVQTILKHPRSMIGSDGLPSDTHPHPRLWGTFPRVLGHYARDLRLFPLETAVHKMTGLSARHFGLADRGEIRVGAFADLVLFDADRVIDAATFDAPATPARGIDTVFVNGRVVYRQGQATGERPGQVLRRAD